MTRICKFFEITKTMYWQEKLEKYYVLCVLSQLNLFIQNTGEKSKKYKSWDTQRPADKPGTSFQNWTDLSLFDEKDYWNSGNQHTAKLFQVWDHRTLRNHSTQWNHILYARHHNLLPLIPWLPVKLLIRFKLRGGYIYFRGYVYSGAQCNRLSLLWVPSFTD